MQRDHIPVTMRTPSMKKSGGSHFTGLTFDRHHSSFPFTTVIVVNSFFASHMAIDKSRPKILRQSQWLLSFTVSRGVFRPKTKPACYFEADRARAASRSSIVVTTGTYLTTICLPRMNAHSLGRCSMNSPSMRSKADAVVICRTTNLKIFLTSL